ncbi:MAG TPA: isopentenyl phosphate kinase [Terracidiphilus sp.]
MSDLRYGCCVVKLGGSLITGFDANKPTIDRDLIVSRAREIAASGRHVVLVHGTGAFGKPPAIRYGYLGGSLCAEESGVVAMVAAELARFEFEVIECLCEVGLRLLRVPALSLFRCDANGFVLTDASLIGDLLERGITPIVGGNFVVNDSGFAVCSSDIIAAELAIALNASMLLLVTKEFGVYRDFGRSEAVFDILSAQDGAALNLIAGTVGDVSGGMRAKIDIGFRAVRHGIPTFVIDGRMDGNLSAALGGKPCRGTRLSCGESF